MSKMRLGICCKSIEPWAGISQSAIAQYNYFCKSRFIKPFLIYHDVNWFKIKEGIKLKNMPWFWWDEKGIKQLIFKICSLYNQNIIKKINLNAIQVEYPPLTEQFKSFKGTKICRFYGNVPLKFFKKDHVKKFQEKIAKSYLSFVRKADFVLPVSNFLVEEIKELNPNIYPIKIGIGTNFFKPLDKEEINKTKVLVHVGKLTPYKGVEELIQIFYEVLKSELDSFLLIIGLPFEGIEYQTLLKRKIMQLKLQKKVHISQYLPQETMPLVYNMCDIFTSCSHWEGYGLPWMEAQACGKPVLAWNVAALPEIIKNNETGYLIEENNIEEFTEKILRLLQDEKIKNKFGKNARKWALKNDVRIMGKRLEEFYKKIMENGKKQ